MKDSPAVKFFYKNKSTDSIMEKDFDYYVSEFSKLVSGRNDSDREHMNSLLDNLNAINYRSCSNLNNDVSILFIVSFIFSLSFNTYDFLLNVYKVYYIRRNCSFPFCQVIC